MESKDTPVVAKGKDEKKTEPAGEKDKPVTATPAKDDKAKTDAPAKDDKAKTDTPAKDDKAKTDAPAKDDKAKANAPAKDDKAKTDAPAKDGKTSTDAKDDKKVDAKDDKKTAAAKNDKKADGKDEKPAAKIEEKAKPAGPKPPPWVHDGTPIHEKCHVTIRCKPLGKGASDSNTQGTDKVSNKIFAGADYKLHTISFKDSKKKDLQVHKFPDLVATGDFDNAAIYDEMMKQQVARFLDGFNVNFFAYGQTGSGKTFTTSGPAGIFKKIGDEALENYPKDFGLFPRAACDIFKAI